MKLIKHIFENKDAELIYPDAEKKLGEQAGKVNLLYETLYAKLPEALKKELLHYNIEQSQTEAFAYSFGEEEGFICGFKYAVKLIIDSLR